MSRPRPRLSLATLYDLLIDTRRQLETLIEVTEYDRQRLDAHERRIAALEQQKTGGENPPVSLGGTP